MVMVVIMVIMVIEDGDDDVEVDNGKTEKVGMNMILKWPWQF